MILAEPQKIMLVPCENASKEETDSMMFHWAKAYWM